MIYFVEDDNSIRALVIYTLNSQNLKAKGFDTPMAFWRGIEEEVPTLILLDIMLPEEDGLHILKRLRVATTTKEVPVMMLTAKDTEYDKVLGLDAGADDYLAKPFGMMELLARVRALLRRTAKEQDMEKDEKTFLDLSISVSKHTVKVGGEAVPLALKEFELLCFLLDNKGIVLTRDQILNRIWGYGFDGESRTVDVHIRTLRQKLGICGEYIETVRGVGYKMGEGDL